MSGDTYALMGLGEILISRTGLLVLAIALHETGMESIPGDHDIYITVRCYKLHTALSTLPGHHKSEYRVTVPQ